MKKLNVIENLEEVKIAFELMEGKSIVQYIGEYSLEDALTLLNKYTMELKKYYSVRKEYPKYIPGTIATIYGKGGIHRYFLNPNGTIRFSIFHMSYKDVSKDAESLGFIID